MQEKLVVPRLAVRRDWFKGLNPDPVDHSHPDVGDEIAGVAGRPTPAPTLDSAEQTRKVEVRSTTRLNILLTPSYSLNPTSPSQPKDSAPKHLCSDLILRPSG